MTWLKIDDKLTTHPKWIPIDAFAESLWLHASVWCASHNNDGVIPEYTLNLHATKVPATKVAGTVAQLVKQGLWKRRPKAKGGGWEIVNWLEYQPSKQQVKERAEADETKAIRKQLHDWLHKSPIGKRVKLLIDTRDGLWCRYCCEEVRVTPGDRRSPHRKVYDLIDPESKWDRSGAALSPEEIARIAGLWVVSCGWCNSLKSSRTPDEAGMVIHPAPGHRGDLRISVANGSRAVREYGPGLAGSDLVGPDRDGTGGAAAFSSRAGLVGGTRVMESGRVDL